MTQLALLFYTVVILCLVIFTFFVQRNWASITLVTLAMIYKIEFKNIYPITKDSLQKQKIGNYFMRKNIQPKN